MPVADMPPAPPPAIIRPAPIPECRLLSNEEAQVAFSRLKQSLPGTAFSGARPSEVCGLVRVQMPRGNVAYTDATGRFLLLALALDTHRGSPADNSEEVERLVEDRMTNPDPRAGKQ